MHENWAWMSPKKEKRCTVPYTMEGLINWARAGGNYGTTDSGQVKRWLIAIVVGGHTDLGGHAETG